MNRDRVLSMVTLRARDVDCHLHTVLHIRVLLTALFANAATESGSIPFVQELVCT